MSVNAREARRRKILERGSDRLALISGQIQSLPSSSKPLISDDHHFQPLVADEPTASPDEDKLVDSPSQYQEHQIGDSQSSTYNGDSSAPLLSKCSEKEAAEAHASEDQKTQSRHLQSDVQDSSLPSSAVRNRHYNPQAPPLSSISLNQISSAVSKSEKTRLCCSAIIALLAVVSYIGFPFVGQSFVRSVFGFRLLYLVLLTNATVVLWRAVFGKEKKGYEVGVRGEGRGTAEQIGKVLEACLGIKKVVDAIFMDCCVFVVIIVSGLSFLQQLKN